MARQANLDIALRAVDQASPGLRSAGSAMEQLASAEAAANASMARSFSSVSGAAANSDVELKRLQGSISKGAAAAAQMSTALSGVGGEAGRVVGHVGSLASSFLSGGPLALGLAATSAAVAIGVKAWEAYTYASKVAEEQAKSLAKAQREDLSKALGDYSKRIDEQRREIANFGLASRDATVKNAEQSIAALREQLSATENLRSNDRALLADLKKIGDEDSENIKNLEHKVELENAIVESTRQRITMAQEELDNARILRALDVGEEKSAEAEDARKKAIEERKKEEADLNAYLHALWVQQTRDLHAEQETRNLNARRAADEKMAMLQKLADDERKLVEFTNERILEIEKKQQEELEKVRREDVALENKRHGEIMQITTAGVNAAINASGAIANALLADNSKMTQAQRASARERVAVQLALATAQGIASAMLLPYPANIAAAISTAGAVVGMFAELASFKDGGIVGETQRALGDRDAIPIIAHRGEAVIPAEQTAQLRRILGVSSGPSAAAGGIVGGRGSQRGATVVNNFSMMVPDSVSLKKAARTISRQQRQLQRLGFVK